LPDLPLTGGCNCGAVRFAIDAPLLGAGYCHCTRCQRRTGSAKSCTALAAASSFRLVSGEHTIRHWDAGDGRGRAFCGTCGSSLLSVDGERVMVRMGLFDADPGVRPQVHIYTAYAAAWEPIADDGLPRFDEGLPG
jgi:hypothetical protein